MSIGFFVADASRWPRTLARLRQLGPLDDDDARMDLRFLENEHRVFLLGKGGGAQFPGRTELMKRWDWTDREVRKLLAANDWQDPNHPVAQEQLRQSFKGARKGVPDAGPMDRQCPANEPPVTQQANVDNPPILSNAGPMAVQCVSIARASIEPRSTTEPLKAEEAPASEPRPGKPPKPDNALTLWTVYRQLRLDLPPWDVEGRKSKPRIGLTPTTDGRKAMGKILDECEDLERAAVYLAWVHESADHSAKRLRGEATWPDGDTIVRLDPVSLSRNIPSRLADADAWEARGRREALPTQRGPPTGRAPPGRRPTLDDTFDALAAFARGET